MRQLKSGIVRTIAMLGYELRKRPAGSVEDTEIPELSFDEFLGFYLQTRDPSNFFFVQIGAYDGVTNDPIHNLALDLKLKGLIAEPQPAAFTSLLSNYRDAPNLAFENAAIANQDGHTSLFTIRKDLDFLHYINQAASFNRGHTLRLLRTHITKEAGEPVRRAFSQRKLSFEDCIEAQPIRTFTFQSLLKKHGVSDYDFLQIDTEGFDYQVLKLANLELHRPSLINYEHEHLSREDKGASWHYLRGLNYQLFTHGGDTTAYLPENVFRDALSPVTLARPLMRETNGRRDGQNTRAN